MSALFGAAVAHYYGLKEGIIGAIVLLLSLTLLSVLARNIDGFSDGADPEESRWLMYGDTALFWTNQNEYLRMNSGDFVDQSSRLSKPTEVPRNWVWEFWTIEDARDSRWRIGNVAPIKYGDKIGMRSWKYNWLRANDNGTLAGAGRDAQCILTIESADGKSGSGTPVKYGDLVCLKTYKGYYLSRPATGDRTVHVATKDNTCIFALYDTYGQGASIDWATRGFATQAQMFESYDANLSIDGNSQTFGHTQSMQGAWWQVELPRDIVVDSIVISNRKDCCQERLSNFDVTLTDNQGAVVYTKYFKDTQDSYTISGIGHIGRTVRVQLRGVNYLHLSEVSVYGTPVKYSNIAESQVVADLVSTERSLTAEQGIKIHPISVPHIGKNNSMSLSMFLKPQQDGIVLTKGTFQIELGDSALLIQIGTKDKGIKTLQSATQLNRDQWNHLAVIVKPAVGPSTGWLYGEFDTAPSGTPGNCCYVVHPLKKEYYYTKLTIPNAVKTKWSSSFVENMSYKGELVTNAPTLTLYVNGNLDTIVNLESDATLENSSAITLGHDKRDTEAEVVSMKVSEEGKKRNGFTGAVSMLRFYNYVVSPSAVLRDSHMQYDVMTVDLVRGVADARTTKTIGAYLLPSVSKQVSVSVWVCSQRAAGEKDAQVYRQGSSATDKTPSLWLRSTLTGDQILAPVQVTGAPDAGVGETKTLLESGTWHHITQIINDRVHSIYIDGVVVDTVQLSGSPKLATASFHIGGFNGLIKDLKYHNYALTADEVRGQMGVHPDHVARESLAKIWKSLGCLSDPFSVTDADWSTRLGDLVAQIKDHNTTRVESTLRDIKAAADKGDKKAQGICYGDGMIKLYTELEQTKKLLTHTTQEGTNSGKVCLPTAPFQCKTQSVNDFDIRTHKDFYKYTETEHVQPPMEDAQLHDELARTRKALADMLQLHKQREGQLAQQSKQGLSQGEQSLAQLVKAQGLSAEEMRAKRKLALVQAAQTFDLKDLKDIQDTPLFREILSQVMNRYFESQQQSKAALSEMETNLKLQTDQLAQMRQRTVQIAQSMLPGLSNEVMNNILTSKGDLSTNAEFQVLLAKMRAHPSSVKQSPEYQDLVKKLNTLSAGEIERGGKTYQDFKVQSHKCAAMFQCGQVVLPKAVLMKVFAERVKTDPQFRALVENVISTVAQKDPKLAGIVKKAEDEQYKADPKFQEFLEKVTKSHVEGDPIYLKTLENMVGPELLRQMQLGAHPEYAQYASKIAKC